MALEIKNIDKLLYVSFCKDENNVFCFDKWVDIYSRKIVFCGVFENNSKLQAAFYYYKDTFCGIPYLHCPPFTPYNGFCLKINSKNFASQQGEAKKIIACIADYFDKLSATAIIRIAFPPNITDMQPFVWNKFKVIPNYTYRISLTQSIDDIFAQMSADKRKDINRALKDGVNSSLCSDGNIVKSVVEKTYDRKSLSVNREFLNRIFFGFSDSSNSFAIVSYLDKIPIATAFCVYDDTTAYYLLGGYDNENKHSGAGALALWNAIQHSKEMGMKIFDFEGSMIIPVEKYFRGFGGQLTPYFVVNKTNIFLELIMKFFKRELY